MSKEIDVRELDFLLRFNIDHHYVSPLDFLTNSAWSAIKVRAPTYLHFFPPLLLLRSNNIIHLPLNRPYFCSGDELH